jgi:hypothetical protein
MCVRFRNPVSVSNDVIAISQEYFSERVAIKQVHLNDEDFYSYKVQCLFFHLCW